MYVLGNIANRKVHQVGRLCTEKGKLCLVGRNYERDDGGTWFPCFKGCLSQDVSTGIHPRDGSAPVLTTTSHWCASHYTHGISDGKVWFSLVQRLFCPNPEPDYCVMVTTTVRLT